MVLPGAPPLPLVMMAFLKGEKCDTKAEKVLLFHVRIQRIVVFRVP